MQITDCPSCGSPLKTKTLQKGKFYTKKIQILVCDDCNYSEQILSKWSQAVEVMELLNQDHDDYFIVNEYF